MAALDDLQASYNQVAARIKEITATPNPTVSIDGESINKTEYLEALTRQLLEIKKAIQRDSDPIEIRTRYYT